MGAACSKPAVKWAVPQRGRGVAKAGGSWAREPAQCKSSSKHAALLPALPALQVPQPRAPAVALAQPLPLPLAGAQPLALAGPQQVQEPLAEPRQEPRAQPGAGGRLGGGCGAALVHSARQPPAACVPRGGRAGVAWWGWCCAALC